MSNISRAYQVAIFHVFVSLSTPPAWLYPHITRNHQRCSQFEDMISKPDELRAAVANSRSRSVRTIQLVDTLIMLTLNNTPPASRLSPCARIKAISGSPFASPQFLLTYYIAIIAQRNASEAPVYGLRTSTTCPPTSSTRCEQHALHVLFRLLR